MLTTARDQVYRMVLAGVQSTPEQWRDIPGNTPEEKAEWAINHTNELIQSGDFTPQEIYSIIRSIPNKDLVKGLSPATKAVSPEPLQGMRGLYYDLAKNTLRKHESTAQDILRAFNGDIGAVVSLALQRVKAKYHPQIADAYVDKPSETELRRLKYIATQSPEVVHSFLSDQRAMFLDSVIQKVQGEFLDLSNKSDITAEDFSHMCYTEKGKPYSEEIVQKLGGAENAKATQVRLENAFNAISRTQTRSIYGRLWAGTDKDILLFPYPKMITKDEVLRKLQLHKNNYPQKPSQAFPTPSPLNIGTAEQRQKSMKMARKDPEVLAQFKSFIESGFENGDGLNIITSSTTRIYDLSNNAAVQALFYFFQKICGGSKQVFIECLEDIGYEHLAPKIYEGSLFYDQQEPELNLSYRSAEEAVVVKKLRNKFGLTAIPYPLSIPVPSDCPTNNSEFIIDFMILCDILKGWNYDEANKIAHPEIQRQMVFVGEYFGFNHDKLINVPENESWMGIDGNVASIEDKGKTIVMNPGAEITVGQKYKLRTEWKQMTETYVAQMMQANVLHIYTNNDAAMMEELDKVNIIYESDACKPGQKCSLAHRAIQRYLQQCEEKGIKPQTPQNQSHPSSMEAYVMSALADITVNQVFKPSLSVNPQKFSREIMYEYYTTMKALNAKIREIETQIGLGEPYDDKKLKSLYNQRRMIESNQKFMTADLDANKHKFKDYMRREAKLLQILDLVRSGQEYDKRELRRQIDAIVSPYKYIESSASTTFNAYRMRRA